MGDSTPFTPRPEVAFQEALSFMMTLLYIHDDSKSDGDDDLDDSNDDDTKHDRDLDLD